MIILIIRTDNPEAEIGLFENEKQLAYENWPAHRQLAETILLKITKALSVKGRTLRNIEGIVCYKGPGSFTGLRIGLTVANALVYAQDIPVVAKSGSDWLDNGVADLLAGKYDIIALPEYGSEANITKPRK